MARVIVKQMVPLNGLAADAAGATVWGEGLDQLDPTVTITPVIKAVFAARAWRVHFSGSTHEGDFKLADNYVAVELHRDRLTAVHYFIYEFQGWQPRGGT